MATAFDTFNQYAFGQYPGHLEDRGMADVVSRLASGSDIGYGIGVADSDYRVAGIVGAADTPTGITLRESVRDNAAGDNPAAVYPEDTEMSVVRVGRVWVAVEEGDTPASGDAVYVIPETGVLTSAEDSGGGDPTAYVLFPNAAFKTGPNENGLCLVQLNGSD